MAAREMLHDLLLPLVRQEGAASFISVLKTPSEGQVTGARVRRCFDWDADRSLAVLVPQCTGLTAQEFLKLTRTDL